MKTKTTTVSPNKTTVTSYSIRHLRLDLITRTRVYAARAGMTVSSVYNESIERGLRALERGALEE